MAEEAASVASHPRPTPTMLDPLSALLTSYCVRLDELEARLASQATAPAQDASSALTERVAVLEQRLQEALDQLAAAGSSGKGSRAPSSGVDGDAGGGGGLEAAAEAAPASSSSAVEARLASLESSLSAVTERQSELRDALAQLTERLAAEAASWKAAGGSAAPASADGASGSGAAGAACACGPSDPSTLAELVKKVAGLESSVSDAAAAAAAASAAAAAAAAAAQSAAPSSGEAASSTTNVTSTTGSLDASSLSSLSSSVSSLDAGLARLAREVADLKASAVGDTAAAAKAVGELLGMAQGGAPDATAAAATAASGGSASTSLAWCVAALAAAGKALAEGSAASGASSSTSAAAPASSGEAGGAGADGASAPGGDNGGDGSGAAAAAAAARDAAARAEAAAAAAKAAMDAAKAAALAASATSATPASAPAGGADAATSEAALSALSADVTALKTTLSSLEQRMQHLSTSKADADGLGGLEHGLSELRTALEAVRMTLSGEVDQLRTALAGETAARTAAIEEITFSLRALQTALESLSEQVRAHHAAAGAGAEGAARPGTAGMSDDALLSSRQLIAGFKCLSCDRDLESLRMERGPLGPSMPRATVSVALNPTITARARTPSHPTNSSAVFEGAGGRTSRSPSPIGGSRLSPTAASAASAGASAWPERTAQPVRGLSPVSYREGGSRHPLSPGYHTTPAHDKSASALPATSPLTAGTGSEVYRGPVPLVSAASALAGGALLDADLSLKATPPAAASPSSFLPALSTGRPGTSGSMGFGGPSSPVPGTASGARGRRVGGGGTLL